MTVYFGIGDSPFGTWCLAWDNLGLVYSNMVIDDRERHIRELKKLFSVTECVTNNDQAVEYLIQAAWQQYQLRLTQGGRASVSIQPHCFPDTLSPSHSYIGRVGQLFDGKAYA